MVAMADGNLTMRDAGGKLRRRVESGEWWVLVAVDPPAAEQFLSLLALVAPSPEKPESWQITVGCPACPRGAPLTLVFIRKVVLPLTVLLPWLSRIAGGDQSPLVRQVVAGGEMSSLIIIGSGDGSGPGVRAVLAFAEQAGLRLRQA